MLVRDHMLGAVCTVYIKYLKLLLSVPSTMIQKPFVSAVSVSRFVDKPPCCELKSIRVAALCVLESVSSQQLVVNFPASRHHSTGRPCIGKIFQSRTLFLSKK